MVLTSPVNEISPYLNEPLHLLFLGAKTDTELDHPFDTSAD
jgi:hypothetical protein